MECWQQLPPPERTRQDETVITQITRDDLPLLGRAVRNFRGVEDADVVRAFAGTPTALAFVAVDGTEILGWCWGHHLARPDSGPMLYLHQLEVAESHRRKGIGRDLLRAFMKAGVKAGATKMSFFDHGGGERGGPVALRVPRRRACCAGPHGELLVPPGSAPAMSTAMRRRCARQG
ncbi:GNAT family N-acetyltransferase [Streptomyces sp. NBC_00439]|uniref:GNAT family N-acetyltransferase n=1 Tax=Streptomyces sp. NBC_00439 TaxID=2903650 RepID=UPI00224DD2B8|nr:GNAT family N-acetyltransferase [Streptomyces sp. NBC_00439]MCX5103286.1 GNAT family N-acetyltransferase [Streptomyces sp. NBC_00439]